MAEACRHDRDGDSGVEHLSGHEVTEIVESEVTESCRSANPDEPLGHKVRRPWPGAGLVGAEYEALIESPHSPISLTTLGDDFAEPRDSRCQGLPDKNDESW